MKRKAAEEIENVIGSERLPVLDDRATLPYIECVLKETLRWHPVAPLGIPHVASADDTYRGYLIPKGAVLIPNIWSVITISH